MKKLVYFSIAILTFVFGVCLYYLRPLVMPVSLYTVSQSVNLYHFNDIHIKANLEIHSKADEEFCCSLIDLKDGNMEGAGFELTGNLKNDENLTALRKELIRKNIELQESGNEGMFVAEIEVVGRIRRVMSCFGPPFYINAREVKQLSPIYYISEEELKKYKAVIHE